MEAASVNTSTKRPHSHRGQDGDGADANGRQKRRQLGGPRKWHATKQVGTVFRILCPGAKTGSIIGKAGTIIKAIRDDTGAMIRVEDAVPGVDERVVTISAKEVRPNSEKRKVEEEAPEVDPIDESEEQGDENGEGAKAPKIATDGEDKQADVSPAQEALFRVHSRIVEIEPSQEQDEDLNESANKIITRLLVSSDQVGCLLGKKGKIIEEMRKETGAQIRVLPRDQLPGCASPVDEVVQISGDLAAVKKALHAVSSQLRDNPPKERGFDLGPNLPMGSALVQPVDAFVPKRNMFPPPGNMLGLPVDISVPGIGEGPHPSFGQTSTPFGSDYGSRISGSLPSAEEEVTFRILCPNEKIGSVIGKGGGIIQSLREETGAKIRIDVTGAESEERVVIISAKEHPDDNKSKAQQAILHVQGRIVDPGPDKSAVVKTKLLVPSDQVGCLIGKGGTIIAEMRKLTHAKIRIYGKEQLPPCALSSDELVQVEGDVKVSQEALIQITTRLRNNLFYGKLASGFGGTKFSMLSGTVLHGGGPIQPGFGRRPEPVSPVRLFPPPSDVTLRGNGRSSSPGSWPPQGVGGRSFTEYGLYPPKERVADLGRSRSRPPVPIITSTTVEVVVPERSIASIIGQGGHNLAQIRQISGAKVKVHELRPGASERVVQISGTPDQTHAAQSLLQAFILSGQ